MIKIFFLFALALQFQHTGFSQKREGEIIDSLLTQLSKAKEDSSKVILYAKIIHAHVYYQSEVGLAYQTEALALAEKIGWKSGLAKIKEKVGRVQWRLGNFPEALKNHFAAMEIYKQTGNKYYLGEVMVQIGQDYLDDGKYAEAKTFLLEALDLSKEVSDIVTIAAAYDVLSYLYEQQGNISEAAKARYNYLKTIEHTGDKNAIVHATVQLALNFKTLGNNKEAIKYFKQGLQPAKEAGDKVEEAFVNSNLADLYITEGNFNDAMKHYAAALKLAGEFKDIPLLADTHRGMGNLYLAQSNYTEALNYYLIAENELKSISNKQGLANLYSEMGIAYTGLKKYDQAKKSFNDAKILYNGLDNKIPMAGYYSGTAALDSATGNWKDAFRNYKQYIIFRDSSFNKETLKKLVISQMEYESDKKEATTKAEQEKKDLVAQEEIKHQRNIRNAAFAVLAVVLLFSGVVFRQRNKIAGEKKRSDMLLLDKELLLKEIHHRVKNNLEVVSSLLALQSAQIDDPHTKEAMLAGQNRVHSIGIVHQKLYQGTNLGAIEMKDYFINLSESILDSFGAEGKINIEFAMEELNLDIDMAVPLGLIVNELLTNTLKYAFPEKQNGSVRIKLEKRTSGILHLEVSDNGVGKSGETKGTGFGGQLISLLTSQLNGKMTEDQKNGTSVFFDFKLEKVA